MPCHFYIYQGKTIVGKFTGRSYEETTRERQRYIAHGRSCGKIWCEGLSKNDARQRNWWGS